MSGRRAHRLRSCSKWSHAIAVSIRFRLSFVTYELHARTVDLDDPATWDRIAAIAVEAEREAAALRRAATAISSAIRSGDETLLAELEGRSRQAVAR